MGFFGQKNYSDMMGGGNGGKPAIYRISQTGCFLVAYCNLLQRYGKDIDPPSLNRLFTQRGVWIDVDDGCKDDLGWSSIAAYDGQIHVTATGGPGWPSSPNSIVKFAYTGRTTGQPTTHFCLVADPGQQTIIDSWDGTVRSPGYYGQPVAWATYENVAPEPVVIPAPSPAPASTATSGQVVILQKNDTIVGIALRYKLNASDILAHNGLSWDDARNLPVGYQVRLPIENAPAPATSGYKVEMLPQPKIMHVSKSGGAEKWMFGNVKQWSDFKSNEHVAENTNVTVVAVANVIVGKDAAAYLMDGQAVDPSGNVKFTIGFNHADLTDGEFVAPPAPTPPILPEAPKPEPTPVPTPEPIPVDEPAPPQASTPPLAPAVEDPSSPNAWKATYKPFPKSTRFLVEPPNKANSMMVQEFDGRRPDHLLPKNGVVLVAGTFIKGQTLYARPAGAVKPGLWFGIPMDNLVSEADIFNYTIDLPTKKVMNYALSTKEKFVVLMAHTVAQLSKFTALFNKK
jgi:hypothetical protein